jgi:hypothetical protein
MCLVLSSYSIPYKEDGCRSGSAVLVAATFGGVRKAREKQHARVENAGAALSAF